jgi:hypothetical protein
MSRQRRSRLDHVREEVRLLKDKRTTIKRLLYTLATELEDYNQYLENIEKLIEKKRYERDD